MKYLAPMIFVMFCGCGCASKPVAKDIKPLPPKIVKKKIAKPKPKIKSQKPIKVQCKFVKEFVSNCGGMAVAIAKDCIEKGKYYLMAAKRLKIEWKDRTVFLKAATYLAKLLKVDVDQIAVKEVAHMEPTDDLALLLLEVVVLPKKPNLTPPPCYKEQCPPPKPQHF